MIHQFALHLTAADDSRLSWSSTYRLYAWLLEQLPAETAEIFHEPNVHLLSQFLQWDAVSRKTIWMVNIFEDALAAPMAAVFRSRDEIYLHDSEPIKISMEAKKTVQARDLIRHDERPADRYSSLQFLTPTAFKQAGRYAIYPQEALILQSLLASWNAIFPEISMQDEDARQALLQGIHITDYRLRTTRFPLKGTKIPGFTGDVTIEAKLSLPLMELWQVLLGLAPYTGIGIKTALGMGGTSILPAAH